MGGIVCKYSTLARIEQYGVFQNSNGCFNCYSSRVVFIQPLFARTNGHPHRITVFLFFFWWHIKTSCTSMNRKNYLSLFHHFSLLKLLIYYTLNPFEQESIAKKGSLKQIDHPLSK